MAELFKGILEQPALILKCEVNPVGNEKPFDLSTATIGEICAKLRRSNNALLREAERLDSGRTELRYYETIVDTIHGFQNRCHARLHELKSQATEVNNHAR